MPLDETQKLKPLRLILSDVDGVLTDGGITFANGGMESKTFHVRDGMGIRLWQEAGNQFGVITARTSHIVDARMAELDVKLICQGSRNKVASAQEILDDLDLSFENVCYIGDDLTDLPLIKLAGFSATVADGPKELKEAVDFVTSNAGGRGAMRELIEIILKGQKKWISTIKCYTG